MSMILEEIIIWIQKAIINYFKGNKISLIVFLYVH